MRVLLAVVLVGIAGCGGDSSPPGGGSVPTPEGSQGKTDKSPAQTANADPVAALEKIGATIKRDDQGEVGGVVLNFNDITDAGLVHLKGMAKLQSLYLTGTKITDAGLVHLKGLTGPRMLVLSKTKVTDTGVADLRKALPNCTIFKYPSSRHRPPTRKPESRRERGAVLWFGSGGYRR
jgi:hypothetical protein